MGNSGTERWNVRYSLAAGPLDSYFLWRFPVKKKIDWWFSTSSERHSLALGKALFLLTGRPCFILPLDQMERVFQTLVAQADFKPQFSGERTLCASSLIFGLWGMCSKTNSFLQYITQLGSLFPWQGEISVSASRAAYVTRCWRDQYLQSLPGRALGCVSSYLVWNLWSPCVSF